jgi:hypothetical protein
MALETPFPNNVLHRQTKGENGTLDLVFMQGDSSFSFFGRFLGS